jgi:alkanesulfonate monooxygenase SsuD/methylene tetrahydromethanopterin reductase-like flavin-dependent oxidoreductase (luciferase family)
LLIMPGGTLYVGRTREEAQAKLDELQAQIDPPSGLAMLHSYLGDLSAYDVDGPVPEVAVISNQVRSIAENLLHLARKDKLSIRPLYQTLAAGNGCRVLIGTLPGLVDDLQHWFESGAADGFNICPATLPQGIDDLAELVIPETRRRGLFRTEYEGTTLRENLGLKRVAFGA